MRKIFGTALTLDDLAGRPVKKKITPDHKHIKQPMATTSPAFDPERIAKIANIVPNFIDFAAPGDEIHLGLEGDPAMPTVYRGSERPTGHIVSIRGNRGERVVEVKLKSGATMELAEPETSPFKVCLLYTSPSPRDMRRSRMPSSA